VFLGDGGSLLLGTIVSIFTFYVLGPNFEFKADLDFNKALFSVLILFYPLLDLLRVFIIRLKNKKSPFEPDQNHLHHVILKDRPHSFKLIFIQVLSLLLFFLITIFI
jgi:UDP-N-acetylmuramyl pentapeptide phosphotransferase/UDP-N-acetylglucosamine-1-phosphate transferase